MIFFFDQALLLLSHFSQVDEIPLLDATITLACVIGGRHLYKVCGSGVY
jgi:hypothetical protein